MNFVSYKNGNYNVHINLEDGTKIRENDLDTLEPSTIESMDIKITNKCSGPLVSYTDAFGQPSFRHEPCPMCHENSGPNGKHADLTFEGTFLDKLHPYTELAIGGGNPLEHPQLLEFLENCKKRKFIPSMTVNQSHLFKDYNLVKTLVDEELIYGLGISFTSANSYLKKYVEEFPNAVVHIINGLITEEDLRKLKDFHCKVLVLGYKTFRRGELLYQRDSERIEKNKAMLNNLLPTIIKENWFEVISFDNLALKQLNVKGLMTEDQWGEFYLGDDGIGDEYNSASMYVDMVERKFAKNSCSVERFDLLDTVEDMYQFLKNRR